MDIPVITDIREAARAIAQGRVVALPTGTSYGLAVDALQGHALQRLRNLKKRPQEKTFSVCMNPSLWRKYLKLSQDEYAFLKKYDYTALTLLVRPHEALMHMVQDGRIGLRVIDNPIMAELAGATKVPLTATSANISGEQACYDTACITTSFPNQDGTTYDLSLACILEGGVLRSDTQSTIARLEHGTLEIIRQGSLVFASNTSD